jgi:hypothetical protein
MFAVEGLQRKKRVLFIACVQRDCGHHKERD